MQPVDVLGEVARQARTSSRFPTLRWLAATGSTNSDLVELAKTGGAEQVLLVDEQTAGRGRLGRTWEARSGSSLLMSVLVRPTLPADRLGLVSPALGLALVDACHDLGADGVTLAWPNDVIVPGGSRTHGYRKLAGILADAVIGGHGTAVVAGVGANIDLPDGFSTERNDPVGLGSLVGATVDRGTLAAAILDGFARRVDVLDDDHGVALVEELRDRCWTVGRDVTVSGGREMVGRAVGVDPRGRLLVESAGATHSLDAGDVSVR